MLYAARTYLMFKNKYWLLFPMECATYKEFSSDEHLATSGILVGLT